MIAKNCIHIALSPLPFLLIFFVLSLFHLIFMTFAIIFALLEAFFFYFFRDVKREIEGGIVSPADGKIMEAKNNKVSIFMSLFDMHVNLMPCDGRILEMKYYRGQHKPAFKNVEKNERLEIEIESDIGRIKLVQIAGIFARRIVPYIKEGDFVKKGEKIGIIRFGSRVELYLPKNCEIVVKKGEKIKAGKTIAVVKCT